LAVGKVPFAPGPDLDTEQGVLFDGVQDNIVLEFRVVLRKVFALMDPAKPSVSPLIAGDEDTIADIPRLDATRLCCFGHVEKIDGRELAVKCACKQTDPVLL
jgi:hypothetical protein